jgi:hypothetical protein
MRVIRPQGGPGERPNLSAVIARRRRRRSHPDLSLTNEELDCFVASLLAMTEEGYE